MLAQQKKLLKQIVKYKQTKNINRLFAKIPPTP